MSYQLQCPNCSSTIAPEQINVQQMVAACQTCGAVFDFSSRVPSLQKTKRRKAKQPDYVTISDSDGSLKLEMPLMTSNSYKIGTAAGAISMGLLYFFIVVNGAENTNELILFSVLFLPFILSFVASFFVRQSIALNAHELMHELRLGIPIYQKKINTDDVIDAHTEEVTSTSESVSMAPRYNMYVDKLDGRREMFMQNLPEEMAFYAEQTLSQQFKGDLVDDRLRLQDDGTEEAMQHVDDAASAQSAQQINE